jgi:dihydroxy-acid dehydratase
MGCLAEALGMSLPGSALVPAVYAERLRVAYASGKKICELVEKRLRPRDILTKEALRNAIKTAMAICGSTNAVLHLSALAREAELEMDVVAEFDALSRTTPQIARVNPAAAWDMEDFYRAGGIPRVMRNLGALLTGGCLTCTGRTVEENLADCVFPFPENPALIRSREDPFQQTGGIAVLRGNLAPATGVTKPGAFAPELQVFRGPARVFDCEEDANAAILGGQIQKGDVLVIRYEGPKGGPGMREMYKAMKFLYGMGLHTDTALVTDGRFSGTNNGCFVGHVSPEAAEGGPLAIVMDGDVIEIDVPAGRLHLALDDEEIRRRLAAWKAPARTIPPGYLRVYAKLASSADQGAVLL